MIFLTFRHSYIRSALLVISLKTLYHFRHSSPENHGIDPSTSEKNSKVLLPAQPPDHPFPNKNDISFFLQHNFPKYNMIIFPFIVKNN
jgi:hypothetical protein